MELLGAERRRELFGAERSGKGKLRRSERRGGAPRRKGLKIV
jgi:hypothetical protein